MGLRTLAQFRSKLQIILGNQDFTNDELDAWINDGVQELAGAVEFDDLKVEGTIDLIVGDYEYGLPAELIEITAIGWADQKRWLSKIAPENIGALNHSLSGIPTLWSRRGHTLKIWKTPVVNETLDMIWIIAADRLDSADDTTQFAPTWDRAVELFAAATAFLDLGDDERSLYWHDRAVKYAGSRMTDAEYGAEANGAPVRLVDYRGYRGSR